MRPVAFVCPAVLACLVLSLAACHLYYVLASGVEPSTDEGHYLTGAATIAQGFKTGTWSGAWSGYIHSLGFKAPLVCVPIAFLMVLTGGLVKPALISLVLTFALLGVVSYLLYRRCMPPWSAAMASALLLTMPMITGLTHRIYVELLLVLLVGAYLAVLAAGPWRNVLLSAGVGLVLALGTLCKVTFPVLVALPTLYSLFMAIRDSRGSPERWRLARGAAIAGSVAVLVAWPWYAENWRAVVHHAHIASSAENCCYYRHWIVADIAAGPGVLVFCLAVAGGFQLWRGRSALASGNGAWMLILLSGLTTIVLAAATVNKATRFVATALPAIAALAAVSWQPDKSRRNAAAALAIVAVAVLLCLHNSFAILPVEEIRAGQVAIIGDRYPLNVPRWYEDNHPLDRRDFHLAEAEAEIARDAEARADGTTREARTTQLGLLIDHDYFQALASWRGDPVHFTWWPGTNATGPGAPDYIVRCRGFQALYPGTHFFDHYPRFEADVAAGLIPYSVLRQWDGPGDAGVAVYARRRGLESTAAGGR